MNTIAGIYIIDIYQGNRSVFCKTGKNVLNVRRKNRAGNLKNSMINNIVNTAYVASERLKSESITDGWIDGPTDVASL